MSSFAIKTGQAIRGAIVAGMLAFTGYVANQPIQPSSVSLGLRVCVSLVPAAFSMAALMMMAAYSMPKSVNEPMT